MRPGLRAKCLHSLAQFPAIIPQCVPAFHLDESASRAFLPAPTALSSLASASTMRGCSAAQELRSRHPAAKRVLRSSRVCARPLASVALRAWSPRPRLATLAPRRVRLRLTPSPRSRRRAQPPTPFAATARAAAFQIRRHPAAPSASSAARILRSMARVACNHTVRPSRGSPSANSAPAKLHSFLSLSG